MRNTLKNRMVKLLSNRKANDDDLETAGKAVGFAKFGAKNAITLGIFVILIGFLVANIDKIKAFFETIGKL